MLAIAEVALLVLLATHGYTSMCPNNNGMSDEVRQVFIDKHNAYRSQVAKGEAKNKLGGYAPKAARMLKMSYDCAIEENIAAFVKECKFAEDSYKDRHWWGQNIWMSSARNVNKSDAAAGSVHAWFSELEKHGVPDNNILTWAVFERGVGHYSQVVWQKSSKIGCAVEWCKDMTLVGCEYDPAGNFFGEIIYDIGNPCQKNEDCQCDKCVCDRERALCIPPQ